LNSHFFTVSLILSLLCAIARPWMTQVDQRQVSMHEWRTRSVILGFANR
jgi:hypothetical protein